jgi:hypothetical protein
MTSGVISMHAKRSPCLAVTACHMLDPVTLPSRPDPFGPCHISPVFLVA